MNKETQAARDKMAEQYGGETPQFAFSDGWDACYNYFKETGQLGDNRAVDLLMGLCQLKHYKDSVGKDAFYEQRQPELWKAANDYLNKITTPPTGQLKEDVAGDGENDTRWDWRLCRCDNPYHYCFVHHKWGRKNDEEFAQPLDEPHEHQELFDIYNSIKQQIGELGYNNFIHSKEVEEYRAWLRNDKYKHRIDWFENKFPNGLYYKDNDGTEYGINIITKQFLAEADAAYTAPPPSQTIKK